MNRYDSYKSSDIDWVGEIPSHWETVQPKYKLSRVTRPIDEEDEVVTCFRDGVVTLRKNRREDGFTNSLKEHGYQQIKSGDLVVHEMDGFAGAIGISDSKGKATPVYTVVQPDDLTDLKYVAYLLREMSQTGKVESLARSIRERTTEFRWNMWSVIHFPFPPLKEQKLISRYLDKKTDQIDSLIGKIQKKIELLKEQRTSRINQCVTKGLDPNVEMKDSGVEWIGEIPKHWETSQLKHLVSENLESLSNSTDPDFELDYIEISDVNSIGKINKPTNYIFSESPSRCRRVCRKGDVIVSTVRTYLKSIGLIEEQRDNLICSTGFSVLTPKREYLSKYIFYMVRSDWFISKVISKSEGVSYPSIQSHKLLGTEVVTTDKQEQQQIVEYLGEQTQKIDKSISIEERRIELLKEYKQSLISEVVTGKRKVVE